MPFDPAQARGYVQAVDLSGTPRGIMAMGPETEAGEVFDAAKKQAQVVGSGVFSFEQGVDTQVREAISDSALLAQLVANKQASAEQDPLGWFKAYSEVLQNLGWTLQESGWVDYTTQGTSAEVHEKILEVATVALAPTVAALAVIKAAVDALKGLNPDSPWLTLFDRESQKANIARFQVGFVSTDAQGDVFVSLLACLIEAKSNITQVLIFKFKDARATFRAKSAKVSVNKRALTELGDAIRAKTRAYQQDYLSGVLNLEL
jgi:hypothetical protein